MEGWKERRREKAHGGEQKQRDNEKGTKRENMGSQCEMDRLQSEWRSRLEGRRNWTPEGDDDEAGR